MEMHAIQTKQASMSSGCITAYPEITPKMEFCPDWRQSNRNSEKLVGSWLEEPLALFSKAGNRSY
jgi:hypothetical protein